VITQARRQLGETLAVAEGGRVAGGEKRVIVGRLPTIGAEEHFGIVLAKGSSLVGCVNKALATLKQDGTLQQLEQQWITGKANAPLITQG